MAGRPSSIHGMPGASSQLNPTEELDKLEQSITLTLQEIDQNFNQCHRIVTHSIMPIIERYTEQSRNVNDGARFWKQFFEFSANVSIGSYETRIDEEETTVTETEDQTYDSHDTINTTQSSAMVEHPTDGSADDSILPPSVDGGAEEINFEESSTDISTPRPPPQMKRWANMESPYETLRKELNLNSIARSTTTAQEPSARKLNFGGMESDDDDDDSPMPKPPEVTMFKSLAGAESGVRKLNLVDDDETETFDESSLPITPDSIRHPPGSHRPRGRMLADTPETARKIPGSAATAQQTNTVQRSKNDILLHRAVDTNWRLQATPLIHTTPKKTAAKGGFDREDSDSPFSSPAPPQITTVLPSFNTPPGGAKRGSANSRPGAAPGGPKTPTSNKKLPPGINFNFDDDDDDDDDEYDLEFSPPVTMQFTLPPSKLLQTPAKEASRRLVRDIMQSAGLDPVIRGAQSRYLDDDDETTTTDTTGGMSLDSPTNLRGGEPTDAFADY